MCHACTEAGHVVVKHEGDSRYHVYFAVRLSREVIEASLGDPDAIVNLSDLLDSDS